MENFLVWLLIWYRKQNGLSTIVIRENGNDVISTSNEEVGDDKYYKLIRDVYLDSINHKGNRDY